MIADGKKWHYLDVKNLPRLLRGITPKINLKNMKKYIMIMIIVMQKYPMKTTKY